jgi:hypothetical protein
MNTGTGAWNRVAVSAQGETFKIWLNGTFIKEFQDSTYAEGSFGFSLKDDYDQTVDYGYFDNFFVIK